MTIDMEHSIHREPIFFFFFSPTSFSVSSAQLVVMSANFPHSISLDIKVYLCILKGLHRQSI